MWGVMLRFKFLSLMSMFPVAQLSVMLPLMERSWKGYLLKVNWLISLIMLSLSGESVPVTSSFPVSLLEAEEFPVMSFSMLLRRDTLTVRMN